MFRGGSEVPHSCEFFTAIFNQKILEMFTKIISHCRTSFTPVIWRMILSTAAACFISLSAGMMYGVTAVLLPKLRQDEQSHYDGSEDSWIASSANLSMILGGIIAGPILDCYGRKLALILIGIPYAVGWICIASARTTVLIIIGRVITGLSTGAHLPIVMVYIGEIVDPKYRTVALAFPLSMLHFGVLIIHLIGSFCSWRITAISCIFPPFLSSVGSCFLRESPLWLISKGKTEEGMVSFRWFRGTKEAAEAELYAVLQRPVDIKKNAFRDVLNIVCTRSFLKPFFITVLIAANIQFSGITVLYFYAKDVFEGTFSGEVDPFIMMMTTDCIRGSLALIVCCFAKILPKKLTFIVSSIGLALFLYILVTYLFLFKEYGHVWVPITCLVFYMGLSGLLIPIGQSFVPEVLPNNVRGFGSGMTSATSYFFQFIVIKVSPGIMKNYGEGTMYACFATFSLVCGLFLIFLLPETEGKTLQSIEDNFKKNIKKENTAL